MRNLIINISIREDRDIQRDQLLPHAKCHIFQVLKKVWSMDFYIEVSKFVNLGS